MGLIGRAIGVGQAAGAIGEAAQGLSEVFVANATREMELDAEIHRATMQSAAASFSMPGQGPFDRVINGLNRAAAPDAGAWNAGPVCLCDGRSGRFRGTDGRS